MCSNGVSPLLSSRGGLRSSHVRPTVEHIFDRTCVPLGAARTVVQNCRSRRVDLRPRDEAEAGRCPPEEVIEMATVTTTVTTHPRHITTRPAARQRTPRNQGELRLTRR